MSGCIMCVAWEKVVRILVDCVILEWENMEEIN